jgi:hypothetical protein
MHVWRIGIAKIIIMSWPMLFNTRAFFTIGLIYSPHSQERSLLLP